MTIVLGPLKFKTSKEAKEYLKCYLHSRNLGYSLNENELKIFVQIMESTEHGRKKIGVGVKEIVVVMNSAYNKAFTIVHIDGSREDISYLKLIPAKRSKQTLHEKDVRAAFRDLVRPKKVIEGNHAHHSNEDGGEFFEEIYEEFLEESCLNPESIELFKIHDHGRKIIKDQRLRDMFIIYHNERAKLIEVSPEEHRKIHSKNKNV